MAWSDHVFTHGDLKELVPGFWQVRGTLKRSPMPRNMCLWRGPTGDLIIHSGVCLEQAAMEAIEALGTVSHVIVPNRFHRADAAAFKERYTSARVVAPRCAVSVVSPVVDVDGTLEEEAEAMGIVVHDPPGMKELEVHLQVHLPNGGAALVMTDSLFNLGVDPPGGMGGLMLKLIGSVGQLGVTRLGRMMFVSDKGALRQHLLKLADLEGLRVLSVAHGPPILEDVSGALRAAAGRL